jgi:hypothetical protein
LSPEASGSNRSALTYCTLNYCKADPQTEIKRPPRLSNHGGHGYVAQIDVVLERNMAILNEVVFPRLNISLFHGLFEICKMLEFVVYPLLPGLEFVVVVEIPGPNRNNVFLVIQTNRDPNDLLTILFPLINNPRLSYA